MIEDKRKNSRLDFGVLVHHAISVKKRQADQNL